MAYKYGLMHNNGYKGDKWNSNEYTIFRKYLFTISKGTNGQKDREEVEFRRRIKNGKEYTRQKNRQKEKSTNIPYRVEEMDKQIW